MGTITKPNQLGKIAVSPADMLNNTINIITGMAKTIPDIANEIAAKKLSTINAIQPIIGHKVRSDIGR